MRSSQLYKRAKANGKVSVVLPDASKVRVVYTVQDEFGSTTREELEEFNINAVSRQILLLEQQELSLLGRIDELRNQRASLVELEEDIRIALDQKILKENLESSG